MAVGLKLFLSLAILHFKHLYQLLGVWTASVSIFVCVCVCLLHLETRYFLLFVVFLPSLNINLTYRIRCDMKKLDCCIITATYTHVPCLTADFIISCFDITFLIFRVIPSRQTVTHMQYDIRCSFYLSLLPCYCRDSLAMSLFTFLLCFAIVKV